MKADNASERTVALVNQCIDVLQRIAHAPESPMTADLPPKQRRELRRVAARLRQGKLAPRYTNLHNAEQLAGIYERAIRRDEILERVFSDFRRLTLDLGRLLETNAAEVAQAMDTLIGEAQRAAEEQGPGSDAAQRYQWLAFLGGFGLYHHSHKRRQRRPAPPSGGLPPDRAFEARFEASAAEILDAPPPAGEPVIPIPSYLLDSGRERILFRIGTGEREWVGSFETGHVDYNTVVLMPGDSHLFVVADGAAYIIEAKTRTLVERSGTDVVGTNLDARRTLLFVNHGNARLEVFGKAGRLWRSGILGCGGFRNIIVTPDGLRGEALHACRGKWVGFSVNLATGKTEAV